MGLTSLSCMAAAVAVLSSAAGASEPPMYTMVELGHIGMGNSSLPMAISDPTSVGPIVAGQSFSTFSPPTLSWRAVAWRPHVSLAPVDLLTIQQAGNSTVNRAQDVSPNGLFIVGYKNGLGTRWEFDPEKGTVTSLHALDPLAGDGASEGIGVNSTGRAAGYSQTDSSIFRGVVWAPGSDSATLLQTPPGSGGLRLAREISEAPLEYIVGRCDWTATPTTRPIIWKQTRGAYGMGEILDLLAPLMVHDAVGITPDGTVAVGLGATGDFAADGVGVAWNTTTNDATPFAEICCSQNVLFDMNNEGVAVGYTGINFEIFRAVLWWEGQPYDLNERIVNNPDVGGTVFLHVATGINSVGQIVGTFGGFASGEPLSPGGAFVLTPVVEEMPGDVNGDGSVDATDLGILLGAWGNCRSCVQCPGDLNGDCGVDAADLAILLGAWTR